MYLSRISIDTKKYDTMKALYNLERLHGMVESSFSGERQRNLWRLDTLYGKDYLLLLSKESPENSILPDQIGVVDSKWETKSYDILLNRITNGSVWNFRLTANPTESVYTGKASRGKRKAITVTEKQRDWLRRQSEQKGFVLQDNQFDVVQSEWKTFKKKNSEVQVLSVTYEGVLTVSDAESFRNTLIKGIGREKAYGMGLLTVVQYV